MMKKSVLFSLLFLIYSSFSMAQFTFKVNARIDTIPITTDTIQACAGITITFNAEVTPQYSFVDTFDYNTAKYYWIFDDGTRIIDTNKDTVKHSFGKGGGYYVYLKITDKFDTSRVLITPVKISLAPNFSGTKSADSISICLGDQTPLTGQVRPPLWEFILPTSVTNLAYEISDRSPYYTKAIYHGSFPADAKIDSIEEIKQISVNLEHSAYGNLSVKLTCPNDSSIFLKLPGIETDTADLGIPVKEESSSKGLPYLYSWASKPTFGTMKDKAAGLNALPETGTYTPDEPWSKLIGCPLNGDWTIQIVDNRVLDNGFIFGWKILFHDSIIPKKNWKYENTYIRDSCEWRGDTVATTLKSYLAKDRIWKGTTYATARNVGSNLYSFNVYDNFGCPHDTTIDVEVTRASLTAEPTSGEAPLKVKFDNTTEWAKIIKWDFDDNNKFSSADTITYTYTHKDTFNVVLIVKSESGCTDTARTKIKVTFPESAIQVPNVFTPNGDNNALFIVVPQAKDKKLADLFTEFECTVFNRYGRRVFHTKDPNDVDKDTGGWDGTLRDNGGALIAPGVYFYVVTGIGRDGVKRKEAGTLTVFSD